MVTLQLKDICGYIPYDLIGQSTVDKTLNRIISITKGDYNELIRIMPIEKGNDFPIHVSNIKPILYPIDYLYKPITHNGKEIIPIVELANLAEKGEWELHIKCTLNNHDDVFFYADGDFVFYIEGNEHRRTNQLPLFDLCHELKIDIRGLIPQGLAMSVDEFEVNPYK